MTNDLTKPKRTDLEPSAKVRKAIELMVFDGTSRDDAAKAAGLSMKGLYNQFRRHHVKRWYLGQLEVLRTSARAKNFHRLEAIRDQDDNRAAAVKAIQVLEQISTEDMQRPLGPQRLPGVTIVVVGAQPAQVPSRPSITIDHGQEHGYASEEHDE